MSDTQETPSQQPTKEPKRKPPVPPPDPKELNRSVEFTELKRKK